jgi:hypothetical protein
MAAKRPRFFEKTYEGRLFAGIVTAGGPYVFDIAAKRGSKLGLSTIVNHGRVQWCISEGDILTSRIPLNSLSDAARKELAYDFGLPFVGFATLSPIVEKEPFHKAVAVEGLIRWMEENSSGPLKKRRGYDELDWALMIKSWKVKQETQSNLRRNSRRRGLDDKQRDLAQVGKTRSRVS